MALNSNALWQYSLAHYPRIKALVLPMQDNYGLNINLLLLCGYAQSKGCAIDEHQLFELLEQTASWHQSLTAPYRALRRELKSTVSASQYQRLLEMELALEKEEQWRLLNSLPELPENNPEAAANVLSCLVACHIPLETINPSDLHALLSIGELS